MAAWRMFSLGIVAGTLTFGISCTLHQQTPPVRQYDAGKLMEIVRGYGHSVQTAGSAPLKLATAPKPTPVDDLKDNESEYRNQIAADLIQKDYAALEDAAHDARIGKTRFTGGSWKLFTFYLAVSSPIVGNQATDEDWTYHIANLKAWAAARPDSATARIALSDAYQDYAEKARGQGYSNTVSTSGWKLYSERYALSAASLADAAEMKEKCPYWYESMQHVALAQGWEKAQAKELFEQAVAFEPTYYHYYREYAYYLLPKWEGNPGEVEAFAKDVYERVRGQYGAFLYFEIATQLTCQCDSNDTDMENLSWPRIKEGYAALGQLYGYSTLKNNRYAHMAFEAQDKPAAQEAFAKIGDDWDHMVWKTGANFDRAKAWAVSNGD
jgi:hypothetical protein